MSKMRVVITGIGVLASNGIGKDAFWKAQEEGKSGIKPVTLFDTAETKSKLAGEISNFTPEEITEKKGLRTMDRATKLILCATELALQDAGLKAQEPQVVDAGVVVGSTLGSVWSISEFDKLALREGPKAVNPAHFPNTVINSPASQVSIRFGMNNFNTTIATGFSASLDAFGYALDFLNLNRSAMVFVGGVEELCIQTFLGFYKLGVLSGSKRAGAEMIAPFDKKRNGMIIGEGAGMLVLETLESAKKRGAQIYAEVLGYASAFDPRRRNGYNPQAEGASRALKATLEDARVSAKDIDYICASANGTLECDVMEARAINKIFGNGKTLISAIKSQVGECFSASGVLQAVSSLGVLAKGLIPATLNLKEIDERCSLDNINTEIGKKAPVDKLLINSFGPNGCNSGMVLGKI